jgi:hypothetical protein
MPAHNTNTVSAPERALLTTTMQRREHALMEPYEHSMMAGITAIMVNREMAATAIGALTALPTEWMLITTLTAGIRLLIKC